MPREQRGGDDDIEPFLDHFAVDAGHFQHQEGENRGHHQLPHAFHPQMDDIPPEHLVFRQVGRVIEREQEEDGDAPQAEQQHIGDRRLAPLQHRHRDVEQEDQRGDDDAELHPQRLLEIGARVGGDDVEEIARHRRQRAKEEDGELDIGEFRRIDLALRLFGNEIIGGSRKSRAAARRSAHWCGSCAMTLNGSISTGIRFGSDIDRGRRGGRTRPERRR